MNRWLTLVPAASALGLMAGAAMAAERAANLPLAEFMGHVLQRNAEQLWAWSEEWSEVDGNHSGAPRTTEEWEAAESDALTLGQLARALGTASFRPADSRWDDHAARLLTAATASAAAAERQDYQALSAAGEEVNASCVACHQTFAPALEEAPPPAPLP